MFHRYRCRRAAAALAVACLGPAAPAPAEPKVHVVVMEKMRFGAFPAGIRAGDVILWVNRDVVRHTATARDRSFHVDLPGGRSGRTVVRRPGTVAVFCKYHPGMAASFVASK